MVKLLSPDHEIHRRSGRPPMPRAHPTAIRDQILSLRSQGLSLVQIASQLLLPYSSVRRLCRRHRDDPARPLNPDYSRCGRRHTAATEALFQAACALKRNHPTWGAGIIRVQLSEQYPGPGHALGSRPPAGLPPGWSQSPATATAFHPSDSPSHRAPSDLGGRCQGASPPGQRPTR
jgi:hypothetical protein